MADAMLLPLPEPRNVPPDRQAPCTKCGRNETLDERVPAFPEPPGYGNYWE